LLRPLVDAIGSHVMAAARVRADDTTVPMLAPGYGKTKTGRPWCYVRDDHPFAGYAGLYQQVVTEAVCMAHVRRKFFDVHAATQSPQSQEALQQIAALYAVEASIRDEAAEIRLKIRTERSAPLFAHFRTWLDTTLSRVSGKSEMAKAIRYALVRWDALTLVLRDGRACIDNNAAKRSMRSMTLGRKNWLFAGSDAGGERIAAIYTLIEAAKVNGLDPEDYLRHLQAFLCTDLTLEPAEILARFVFRWRIETTFQEVREHLGVETQQQWSDLAILRTTPALLGLYSLVAIWAHALMAMPDAAVRPHRAAWYKKSEPTFSDAIAAVRRVIWTPEGFSMSRQGRGRVEIPVALLKRFVDTLRFAA